MMGDDQVQRLSAALRAQAAGMTAGFPVGPELPQTGPGQVPPAARLPAWAVLALAVLLGATAGALAGAISAW